MRKIAFAASPTAYWQLDENAGASTAVDTQGVRSGTYQAGVTPGTAENIGTAPQFQAATNSYVLVPANAAFTQSGGSMTVEVSGKRRYRTS